MHGHAAASRGIYDELFTVSQFSSSSEYLVVDGGGATMGDDAESEDEDSAPEGMFS